MQKQQSARGKVLEKIFIYHQLDYNKLLVETWEKDLKKYEPNQIEEAWDSWRKDRNFEGRKPKSYDLVRLIEGRLPAKNINNEPDCLVRGRSFASDLILDGVEKSLKNMPDLGERLKNAKSVYEKFLLCAMAQGDPATIKFFSDKIKNRV